MLLPEFLSYGKLNTEFFYSSNLILQTRISFRIWVKFCALKI